jgi:hypothetical protein
LNRGAAKPETRQEIPPHPLHVPRTFNAEFIITQSIQSTLGDPLFLKENIYFNPEDGAKTSYGVRKIEKKYYFVNN